MRLFSVDEGWVGGWGGGGGGAEGAIFNLSYIHQQHRVLKNLQQTLAHSNMQMYQYYGALLMDFLIGQSF